jgi:hypothetical protein
MTIDVATGISRILKQEGIGWVSTFPVCRVTEPAEIVPALRRALEINSSGSPAYIEFISSQYPVYGQWVGRGE